VGADFFERAGVVQTGAPVPLGIVDSASDLAHAGLDVERVHPAARRFLERTAELDVHIRSAWSPWFRPFWRGLLRPLFGALGQLFLPLREGTVRTRLVPLDAARDGRPGARGVVREYVGTGRTMQIIAYGTYQGPDAPYMSAALPLPLGNLAGLLRLDPIGQDDDGRLAVKLTTQAPSGGVWFATRWFALRVPLRETLSFWAPGMRAAPTDLDPTAVPGCVLVARHEQRLFGALVVAHDYWFFPSP
jgi:hypothetical protein